MTTLIDQHGNPLRKELLTREVAGPSLGGVRSPVAGYPADGMTPIRLADLLREAAEGEPVRYFELAELIEERDLHYAGVLATRKRSVAQIDITVEAVSDAPDDVERADLIREWLKRDELADEIFDMLDAIGKGISFTEIMWDTSAGQYWPEELIWRDPRWFTFDRKDQRTPLILGGIGDDGFGGGQVGGGHVGGGRGQPLPAFKFIVTQIKAKSGLPVRSGIARLAAWAWMFKAFTQRDWAIFTQTYGQPIRVGKFHEGATKEDRATLFRAVANIAGDCAAIVPSSMEIEFIESKNVTAGSELYERRADWLDRQVSKAILGQTTTTDAVSGGHAVSQEHRQVQEDIETADCKSLSATINRDLIRPWMDMEFGPPEKGGRGGYPRLVIGRPKQEDLKQLTDSLAALVPLGLRVQASEIRDKLGISDPDAGAEVLGAPQMPPALPPAAVPGLGSGGPIVIKGQAAPPASLPALARPALQSEQAQAHPAEQIAAAMAAESEAALAEMSATIETMLGKAADLGEFRAMLGSAYGTIDSARLAGILAGGFAAAAAAGRSDLVDESA